MPQIAAFLSTSRMPSAFRIGFVVVIDQLLPFLAFLSARIARALLQTSRLLSGELDILTLSGTRVKRADGPGISPLEVRSQPIE